MILVVKKTINCSKPLFYKDTKTITKTALLNRNIIENNQSHNPNYFNP